MADNNINIDLTNATEKELEAIKNQIVARLADRVKSPTVRMDYDRHGSGHSRSMPEIGSGKIKNPVQP